MSIATYAELKTAIATWTKRDDLTALIPDFIRMGELRIYRELRIRAMEAALSETIASGSITIPDGYVDMKFLYIDATPVQALQRKSTEWMYANYPTRSSDGKPLFYARERDSIIFGPYPDSTYSVAGVYYKRLDALSDTNTTNWFTTNAPDLLLFASLCEAAPYMEEDNRIAVWEQKFSTLGAAIQREDTAEDIGPGPLAITWR